MDINDKEPTKPHEVREDGSWACSAIGMRLYSWKTTAGGYAACGHCVHKLRDKQGNYIPWTLRDCFEEHARG